MFLVLLLLAAPLTHANLVPISGSGNATGFCEQIDFSFCSSKIGRQAEQYGVNQLESSCRASNGTPIGVYCQDFCTPFSAPTPPAAPPTFVSCNASCTGSCQTPVEN